MVFERQYMPHDIIFCVVYVVFNEMICHLIVHALFVAQVLVAWESMEYPVGVPLGSTPYKIEAVRLRH